MYFFSVSAISPLTNLTDPSSPFPKFTFEFSRRRGSPLFSSSFFNRARRTTSRRRRLSRSEQARLTRRRLTQMILFMSWRARQRHRVAEDFLRPFEVHSYFIPLPPPPPPPLSFSKKRATCNAYMQASARSPVSEPIFREMDKWRLIDHPSNQSSSQRPPRTGGETRTRRVPCTTFYYYSAFE